MQKQNGIKSRENIKEEHENLRWKGMKYQIKMLDYLEATMLDQNATPGKHLQLASQDSYLKA